MPKKGKRISKHPLVTAERLEKRRADAKLADDYYLSEEGQAEMAKWKQESKKKRGGKRKGSGRKSIYGTAKVKTSTAFSVEVKEYAEGCGLSLSQLAEEAIRRTKAFRDWKKSKSTE